MFKTYTVAAALAFSMLTGTLALAEDDAAPAPAKPKPHSFVIQDNEMRWGYGSWFRDPYIMHEDTGKPQNISKHLVEYIHVDLGSKLGDNLFTMQYWSSNKTNPVSRADYHSSLGVGAKDVYMTFRHDVVLSRLFPNVDFSWGPIKDVIVTAGADFGGKNDDFANQRRSPMVGPGVQFKIPNGGYLKLIAMWTREWNNEGTAVTEMSTDWVYPTKPPHATKWGKPVVYDNSYTIQTGWGVPFALGRAPMIFEGFGAFNGAKGYSTGTKLFVGWTPLKTPIIVNSVHGSKPETLLHGQLMYNFGQLFGPGHVWQVGVGYEYWNNMFGVDHHYSNSHCNSCLQNAPFVSVAIHL